MTVIGIRREDKGIWERRSPLVPEDVAHLVNDHGLTVHVQSSERRCFPDDAYRASGAKLTADMAGADVILGVKEIPLGALERNKTYMFFSHTIKGQPSNMPMLQHLLELGCTLLDYELVEDDQGVRTIAFGRFAGLAGAIDTLWALGKRFAAEGLVTPFARMRPMVEYGDVAAARSDVAALAADLAEKGLPRSLTPLVIAVTGEGGKVFGGAMEIFELLPHLRVDPRALASEVASYAGSGREILLAGFGGEHLVEPVELGARYSWEHYIAHPSAYRARFGRALPFLTAILHGIYWREGYPRFILRQDLAQLWREAQTPRLRVITDVTCDLDGSNESLVRITDPGHPAYVYDPISGQTRDGVEGEGPVVLGVDILPAEVPVDASRHFSKVLAPLVPPLVRARLEPDSPELPASLRKSFVAVKGRLIPRWEAQLRPALLRHGSSSTKTSIA